MDPDLYDEFGNYVGPELESEDESSEEEKEDVEEDRMDEDDDRYLGFKYHGVLARRNSKSSFGFSNTRY